MSNPQYFSKFAGVLAGNHRRENPRPRRSSPFKLESLEARVLLSADLGGAISVADILNSPTFGNQQAVVQDTQPVQVPATTYSAPAPTLAPTSTPSQATGQIYYVSSGGSDSNAGSASSPWHSIQAAAQRLQAGDTAILMDGTYQEGSISFANSGTADNPITIKAQNKWGAILSSTSGDSPAISINKSYITIEDLRISVSPNNQSSGVLSSANCAIRAFESNEPTSANPTSGVVGLTARGLLIDYSAQRTTGIKSNQDFTLIENCEVHSALELYNNKNSIVRNNVVYGNDGWGDSFTQQIGCPEPAGVREHVPYDGPEWTGSSLRWQFRHCMGLRSKHRN